MHAVKMRNREEIPQKSLLFLLSGLILLSALSFVSASPAAAISIPEKLVYDLTWTGIKAGTAIQEVNQVGNEIHIVSTARSADWISTFFPVEDRIESVLTGAKPPGIGLPRSYRMKIREGSHRRDREILFDQARKTSQYRDHLNGEKVEIDLPGSTFDTLSSFYFVRTLKLEVGKPVFLTILDNKKVWRVEVQVLRKEKLKTRLGNFDTIVIKPLLKSEGIMDKRGDMYIWLTDDHRLLPVKMKTKVKVGSITATLVGGVFQKQQ
ncbi:MAG: DUF3108 domain-containing protein [Geobacteraceae bacterium]|nr:DUF3108 domain-containing protein [Geobacteraceae bacterium]